MGLARWAASKLKRKENEEDEVSSSDSLLQKTAPDSPQQVPVPKPRYPYRDLNIGIPEDATANDLDDVLSNLIKIEAITHYQARKYFRKMKMGEKHEKLTREDYSHALRMLMENDELPAETLYPQIGKVRHVIAERARLAAITAADAEKQFAEFVEDLDLSEDYKQKLLKMVTVKNYERAVKTAQEMDPSCEAPPLAQITGAISALGPKKIQDICEMMKRPRLIIVPNNSFRQKVKAMNDHKPLRSPLLYHFQKDAIIESVDYHSPFDRPDISRKARVSIVDGFIFSPNLEIFSYDLEKRRRLLGEKYSLKKMRHIDILECWKVIIDGNYPCHTKEFYSFKSNTFLDPDSLSESEFIALGNFYNGEGGFGARFKCQKKFVEGEIYHGRPTLPLIEF
jgi:hypothetical protein